MSASMRMPPNHSRRSLSLWAALRVVLGVNLALASTAATPKGAGKAPTGRPGAFRIEHALTLNTFADLAWSADGLRLAFVVTSVDTAENTTNQDLWMVDLAADRTSRLTRHARPDLSPTFSPSGDTIAFVSNRGTGDDAKSAIHLLSLHGGEPWAFGSYDEAVSEVRWSPDGRHLAYVKVDTLSKSAREWHKKKWDHVVEDEILQFPHLWVVEIATGKQRRLTSGPQHVWYARWSPDSRRIAYLTRPTGKPDDANLTDIGVVAIEGGPERKLGVIGGAFAWSPDSRWIALATGADRDQHVQKSDLWVVPAAGGKPRNLTHTFDEDARDPAWNPTSDTLFFHVAAGARTMLATVARAGGPVELPTRREGEAGAPTGTSSGRMAWVESSPTEPNEIWIADHAAAQGRDFTSLNASVARLALGTTRTVSWISSDGIGVEGLLLRPRDASDTAPLKTVVFLHGGPYGDRYALGFQTTAQLFASRGYQVFMPNFRSSGGYGTAFMLRKRSDWGGQDWQDVMTGVDSLVRRRLVDPKRLGVTGRSYGGYLTAWAITQTERFDAACVMHGAVELSSFYGQSDVQKYRAFEFQGFPWESPEKWARSSPMTHIKNVRTPTLLLTGEEDRRVPYPQAQQLYRALRGLGVPTEFVHYPREGHVVREYRHRWDQMNRMVAWFDRWIR
ncbi:MAG TPA: S9 family peptidase [Candidatus Limnocylindria bacterium]|nr:S9 family peptidase [Candidatus Limnocylindria bacterium]